MHARSSAGTLDDAAGLSLLRRLGSATVLSIGMEEPHGSGGRARISPVVAPPVPEAALRRSAANGGVVSRPPQNGASLALAAAAPQAGSEPRMQLGAPLLPERADDPHFYPGIVDDVPDVAPSARPVWVKWAWYAGAGLALFAAGLLTRSLLVEDKPGWSALIQTKPADTRVTLDGRVLAGHSPFRQEQLPPGEHQLRVERAGFLEFRESFVLNDVGGQRDFVIALDPIRALREAEAAPAVPKTPEPPRAPPPPPSPVVPPAAAEVASPQEVVKQHRLEVRAERLAQRQERKAALAKKRAERREAMAARTAERKGTAATRAAERKEAAAARAAERKRKRAERS
jgi:hypothetical protein